MGIAKIYNRFLATKANAVEVAKKRSFGISIPNFKSSFKTVK